MEERPDAFETALRALRARDRSVAELADRLERRGVGEDERAEVLERLDRVGYVDDERFARQRAAGLAERGAGDALIRDDLERRGVAGAVEARRPPVTSRAAASPRRRCRVSLRRRSEKR